MIYLVEENLISSPQTLGMDTPPLTNVEIPIDNQPIIEQTTIQKIQLLLIEYFKEHDVDVENATARSQELIQALESSMVVPEEEF